MAEKFKSYEAIYFPHQFDFRGRMYPVPGHLNPQGPDYVKALLTFSEGKPIEDGLAAGWLAIHGANVYGYDKVSLEDRIEFIEEMTDDIIKAATDPWAFRSTWEAADKPWQFLAFCFEWALFQTHGFGFVSSLPVALDGSCNGLQHFSAALRDPVGGAAVNLLPADAPADIYAEVAKVTEKAVQEFVINGPVDPGRPEWFARKWLEFGIDRKITKRSVMTLPYGSTRFSCRDFIEEAVREKLEDGRDNPFRLSDEDDGVWKAALFLQDYVWDAIGEVVVAAVEAMDWLKDCARIVAKEGLPLSWKMPDGFVAVQDYRKTKLQQVWTYLDGSLVKPSLQTETPTLDSRRMAQGVAPNYVHSLDGCALRRFALMSYCNGVRSLGVVHDSFSTVAADVSIMDACIKGSFSDL